MADLEALGQKPAGQDQIERARELAAGDELRLAELDALVATSPNRAQMLELLDRFRRAADARKVDQAATALCRALGSVDPSPTEKLLALQVQVLHEQAVLLRRIGNLAHGAHADATNGPLTAAIGGILAAALVTQN